MNCGQYSAEAINRGDIGPLSDADLKAFTQQVQEKFQVSIVGVTVRYPDSFEQHRWESVALDAKGNFYRSPAIKPIVLWDRIGGGDTWNSGFYYGLLTETNSGHRNSKRRAGGRRDHAIEANIDVRSGHCNEGRSTSTDRHR
jgi:sugar/nucleoside kinase (ribokinase family)